MAKKRANGEGNVRKRKDGRWEGRIVAGHKENGKPIFRYVLAPTQKELLAKLHQNIELHRSVELTDSGGMTLCEWLDRWLAEYASPRLRESTLRGYRCYVEHYIKPALPKKKLATLTATDIQKLYARLQKHGRVHLDEKMGRQLAGSTVRRVHNMLHRALKDAVTARLIPHNPADDVTAPKASCKPKKILNNAQLDRFMEVIKSDPVWHDFFYTELTTGLRRGEICGLQWRDFDADTGTLQISRTIHTKRGGGYTTGETKTGKGRRKILLPTSTAELLRERKRSAHSEWIFTRPLEPNQPVSPGAAYRRLKQLLEESGLPDISFHALRHVFSTMALEHGMDVKTLSAVIGHVSAKTTLNIYIHVTDAMRQSAADKIDRGIAKCEPAAKAGAAGEGVPTPGAGTRQGPAFEPYRGKIRKAGTGCVTQRSDHLWEGKFSPRWPDGKIHSRNVYAATEAECEEKLAELIREMKEDIAKARRLIAEGKPCEASVLASAKSPRGRRNPMV